MTNMSLLQFILQLLGDDDARAEFDANPKQTLSENGFDNLCGADVRDARPLIVDNVQTAQNNSFDRELSGGGNSTHVHHTPPPPPPPAHDDGMDGAIREINYITQHYSWSDSHNTVLDNSVNQNIWADGDVLQWFDNDPVVASGEGAVAAGDDIEGTVTTGDRNVVGHGNDVNHVGSAAASSGGAVAIGEASASGEYDANDYSTDVEAYGSGNVAVASNGSETEQRDSHDTDNSVDIDDSYNTDNSVDIDDSYNSESETNTDNSVDDSYNTETETETNTDNSVDVEDSYNSETETNTDNSVEVEESFNSEKETNTSYESTEVETTVTNTDNSIDDSFNDTAVASNNELEVEDVVVIG